MRVSERSGDKSVTYGGKSVMFTFPVIAVQNRKDSNRESESIVLLLLIRVQDFSAAMMAVREGCVACKRGTHAQSAAIHTRPVSQFVVDSVFKQSVFHCKHI